MQSESAAAGGYDVGFGDVNALIRLAAIKPEEAPICVYQMYNKPPFTIAVLSKSDIKTAKDLEGRKLGGAANDGALKLFPAFSKVAGLDTSGFGASGCDDSGCGAASGLGVTQAEDQASRPDAPVAGVRNRPATSTTNGWSSTSTISAFATSFAFGRISRTRPSYAAPRLCIVIAHVCGSASFVYTSSAHV